MIPAELSRLKGKDFINLEDFSKQELLSLLDFAAVLKQQDKEGKVPCYLAGKTVLSYYAKPSLRTRLSFEIGAGKLGAQTLMIKQDEIILGQRESIEDTARVMSGYAQGITIRTFAHADIEKFARFADVPVINALTDASHPCQIMADLLTVKEQFGGFDHLKICFIGDGNNVCNTLVTACALLGIDLRVSCPAEHEPDPAVVDFAKNKANNRFEIIHTPDIRDCRVIYTDTWVSMGQEKEAEAKRAALKKFQLNDELMKQAPSDCIVLHCLPAHKGEEITSEVFERYAPVIFSQAQNRMYAQMAIMAAIM